MGRLVVFQHVAAEPLGTLDALIRARGHRVRFVNFEREPDAQIDVTRYDGLIVLGGPMMVDQRGEIPHLNTEIRALRTAIDAGQPILGICLGAQLLAHTLGGQVGQLAAAEIGWYPLAPTAAAATDPVLTYLATPAPVFQWHRQGFRCPPGAVRLATSPGGGDQAFRYGDHAYGFQFHLEMDRRLIERWLSIPAYRQELAEAGTFSADAILRDSSRLIQPLNTLADRVFSAFLDRVGPARPRKALPSR
ncbi:MAG: gamma-glutamyl-gamma-aminobutyrate hydrolase family protein [Pseudomonadota bacterium]